ncbi:MAG TPA: lipopolysaccharide heptosyltransferase II [Blastocatellia bacterium]|nr:lipopolysaccharide heptosyltransferase II [Blastocatellia bacterium]
MSEASSHTTGPSLTPNPQPLSPAKLLIRAPNWVGDAVMALPALRELRRIYGKSRITLAARPWVAGLFENEGLADNLVPVRDASGFFNRARHFISDAHRLRRERFDYAVLLPNSFGSALAARAGGAKKIAGYASDGRRLLLDHVISFDPDYKKLHQVRYYLNIAAQIESKLTGESRVDFERCEPRLHVSEEQKDRARFMLERFGASTGANAILAINPGATNSTAKRWPAERFAEIADRLSQRDGFETVIVGAESDTEVAERVAGLMRTSAVVLAGKTSIAELKAVLSCARLVISNDTGAAHVSAALGVSTVVVFGPTEHVSTRPLSQHAVVIRHDVECSPCMLRECPIDHRCMTRLEVEDVYRAARRLAGC